MTSSFFDALAGRVVGLSPSDEAFVQARLCLVDTLACMLAARSDPLPAALAGALARSGAEGPAATVLPGIALAAGAAALVNGAAAHVLDFDDYEIPGSTHPSAPIVPVLLALSDLRRTSLGTILQAYLAGYDAIVCCGRALGGYAHYLKGWHATATIGPVGAAAAASHLIGLDASRTAMAMALATSSSAGLKLQFGSHAKPVHAGLAARAGLEAAMLVEAGITANAGLAEGPHGFFALYGGGAAACPAGPSAMETDPVLRKPWPSCAYTHRAIEAALELAAVPGFDAAAVASGTIALPEPFFRVAGFLDPVNPAQARFSVRYCVASALVHGSIGPATFEAPVLADSRVRALMTRLNIDAYDAGSALEDMSPDHPDSVVLEMADGGRLRATVAHVRGGLAKPLDAAAVGAKFQDCGGGPRLLALLMEGGNASGFRFAEHAGGPER
jgi:2-methylcitrate dehydratase PrpD